jgi:sec-independent protein translocase protein TatA
MFGLPAGAEWIAIIVVVMVLFGGDKLPSLLRTVGKGMGQLQRGVAESKRIFQDALEEEEANRK